MNKSKGQMFWIALKSAFTQPISLAVLGLSALFSVLIDPMPILPIGIVADILIVLNYMRSSEFLDEVISDERIADINEYRVQIDEKIKSVLRNYKTAKVHNKIQQILELREGVWREFRKPRETFSETVYGLTKQAFQSITKYLDLLQKHLQMEEIMANTNEDVLIKDCEKLQRDISRIDDTGTKQQLQKALDFKQQELDSFRQIALKKQRVAACLITIESAVSNLKSRMISASFSEAEDINQELRLMTTEITALEESLQEIGNVNL